MFRILANSFMTATRVRHGDKRDLWNAPPSWLENDLPFRSHAGQRTGRDD